MELPNRGNIGRSAGDLGGAIFDLDVELVTRKAGESHPQGHTNQCGPNSYVVGRTCWWTCTGRTGSPCAC